MIFLTVDETFVKFFAEKIFQEKGTFRTPHQVVDALLYLFIVLFCMVCFEKGNLVPRVSRARRDPGRVWSRASVTIENTREGSSLNKESVDVLHSIYFKS